MLKSEKRCDKKENKGLQQIKNIKLSVPFQEIPFHIYKTSIAFFVAEVFKIITSISLVAEIIVYLGLAGFSVLTFLFVWFYMTETAGKEIE